MITSTLILKDLVTAEVLKGALAEVVGLLPVIIPVSIGYIGIRKGVSFLLGMIRRA